MTEHFFRWGAFCEKFVAAEGSLWLSKQQLNFHQNTSLPEEASTRETTKSFPLFYIEDRKGENQIRAKKIAKILNTDILLHLTLSIKDET